MSDEIKPTPDGGCSYDECPQYDGKRCRMLGFRPGTGCEPGCIALRSRAETAERGVAEHEASWAKVFSACLPVTGTADGTTVGMVRRLVEKHAASEALASRLAEALRGLIADGNIREAMDALAAYEAKKGGGR